MATSSKPLWVKIVLPVLLVGTAPLAYAIEFRNGYDSGFEFSVPILGAGSLIAGFLTASGGGGITGAVVRKGIILSLGLFVLNFAFMCGIFIGRL